MIPESEVMSYLVNREPPPMDDFLTEQFRKKKKKKRKCARNTTSYLDYTGGLKKGGKRNNFISRSLA